MRSAGSSGTPSAACCASRAPDWPGDADSVVYHYDAAGQIDTLIRTTLASPATGFSLDTVTFTYDTSTTLSTGGMCRRLRTMKDAMGGITQVPYGTSGMAQCVPAKTIGLATDTTLFTYSSLVKGDAAAVRPISVRDPNGLVQNMQYDAVTWNSAVSTRAADGAVDRLYYDALGRPDSLVDPLGVRTFYRHDQSGRVLRTKTGTGLLTPVTWSFFNPSGLVDSVRVYGAGDNFATGQDSLPQTAIQTTVSFYDRLGHVDSTRTPGGRVQRFQRDRRGAPIWEHPGNGTYLTRAYDWQGRLTAEYQSPVTVASGFADATTLGVYAGLGVAHGYTLSARRAAPVRVRREGEAICDGRFGGAPCADVQPGRGPDERCAYLRRRPRRQPRVRVQPARAAHRRAHHDHRGQRERTGRFHALLLQLNHCAHRFAEGMDGILAHRARQVGIRPGRAGDVALGAAGRGDDRADDLHELRCSGPAEPGAGELGGGGVVPVHEPALQQGR